MVASAHSRKLSQGASNRFSKLRDNAGIRPPPACCFWQKGIQLALHTYRLSRRFPREETYGLTSQIRRAAVSVPANIAEGNGKFSRRDRARFFQIAHGSTLESAACLDLLVARRCCSHDAIVKGKATLEEIVRMLFKMLDQLGCRIAEMPGEYGETTDEEEAVEEDLI